MRNIMKKPIYTVLLFVITLMMTNCTRTTAEKDFDSTSALLSALLTPGGETDAQKTCQTTVSKANECIAPGFGYDAYNSCHSSNITGTSTQWTTLLKDVSTAILTNACNLPHKRYQGHSAATAGAFTGITNIGYLKGKDAADITYP